MDNIRHRGYLLEKLTRPEKNVNRENNGKRIDHHIAEVDPTEKSSQQYQNQQQLHKIGGTIPSGSLSVCRLYSLTVGL
jgi:hypothetical protein